ncbi:MULTISPECIES: hypothetical protein [Listeria]|uniref:hypothetical protein n=1 Tax=Listeria TaxID=1637 RepID=UPI000B58954C|nr:MULTISPECIES: hypothetical protein [Listeria]
MYALFGLFIIKISTQYLVILSTVLGIAISILLVILIDFASKKSFFGEIAPIDKIAFYFKEGEKQFKKIMWLSFWTLMLAMGSTIVLYVSNGETIIFFATSLFWMLPLPLFVLQSPFKRRKIYELYKKNKLPIID